MAATITASSTPSLLQAFGRFSDVLGDALLLVTPEGTVVAASARAGQLLGFARAQLVDRSLVSLVANATDKVQVLLHSWARTRQALPGTLEFRHSDGRTFICRCDGGLYQPRSEDDPAPALVLVRLSSRDGPGNRFVALNRQIGELSQEIRRRATAEAELHAHREWLKVTLSGIGDAVIATDIDARITFINPAASLLTGWCEQDALGTPLLEVFRIVNEDTRAPVESPIERVLREGRVCGLANHTVLIRRDGSEVPIDDSGAPIRDQSGEIIGAVLVFHDITERRRLERELRQKAQALEELNRKKDEFLAMLSHELRNPLAPLRNCIAVLEHTQAGHEDTSQLLAIMARQVSHLTRLIDDLLDVSRITTGRIRLVMTPVQLEGVLTRAVESVQPLAEARGHHLEVALEPALIRGDEARLAQVFINLLENAIKYTPRNGSIKVSASACDGRGIAVVEDSGIGIEPAMLTTIFELFAQGERSLDRSQGGLGVGLALVRTLVGLHDGTVEAVSAGRGCGSRFLVSLPLADDAAFHAADHGTAQPPHATGRRVMVVDDSEDVAQSLALVLGSWGYEVRTADNAATAHSLCNEQRPDVAILDIGLPGTDGYTLARELRAAYPGMTLIALTGYGMAQDRERAKASGFDHHLTKPGDLGLLRMMLTEPNPG